MVLRRVSSKLAAQWASLDRFQSRRVRSAGELATLGRLKHWVAVLRLTGVALHRFTSSVLFLLAECYSV